MPDTDAPSREMAAVRRALAMIQELEARLAAAEGRAREPVAVIGLACRFPGEADSPAGYWRLLAEGRDAIGPVPADRWDAAAFHDPDPDAPGRAVQTEGGFLPDVAGFDAALFGISRREAEVMDPQQRLLLETAWEALEDAAIAPDRLAGRKGGVFVGLSTGDYGTLLGEGRDLGWVDGHASLGNAASVAAGRIAYTLGLTGPALVVDTACSSSLVAVHLAMQALRRGECDMALAAGVSLMLSPALTIAFSKARMLSADARCKSFDAAADGYVRGEGCGVLVLKRLSDARRDGDRVVAVLRGSAVNQDGRSAGLTAPSGPAQEAVIRAALADAGLDPAAVDAIEAHGTGTALGDPIEMGALRAVFGDRAAGPLHVGSVKTNIGHAEAAAGIAGLIKAVLMLRQGAVAPSLHFRRLNPHIDLGGADIRIPTALTPAPLRRVGVSSFGFSGTNAHVVVEAAEAVPPAVAPGPRLLALSGRSAAALQATARRWRAALEGADAARFAALCRSAAGRAAGPWRLAVVASEAGAAAAALEGAAAAATACGRAPRVAFLCPGQGAAFAGMGAGLVEAWPVFAEVIARCDAAMGLDRRLVDLFGDAEALRRTEYAQPALFALAAGLGALWRSWGVEPVATLGHSLGEYAAAHLGGVLELEDAAGLVAERGRLMASHVPSGLGAMAALLGPAAASREVLARHPEVELAAENGPASLTVAGAAAAVARLVEDAGLAAAGVVAQALPGVAHAFHTRLIEPALRPLEAAAGKVAHHAPRLPVIGNLTGAAVARHDGAYWRAQARAPVRFAAGLEALARLGVTHVVELGPQPVLSGLVRGARPELVAIASLTRARGGVDAATQHRTALLEAAGRLWREGATLDWRSHHPAPPAEHAPTSPFERQRFWFAPPPSPGLAGERIALADGAEVFRQRLDARHFPYLAEHVVGGEVVVPGAAHALTMLAASGGVALRDIVFAAPLTLQPTGCELQITLRDGALSLHADAGAGFVLYASAAAAPAPALPPPCEHGAIAARCSEDAEGVVGLHAMLASRGIVLGPAFRGIRRLFRGEGEALAEVALPDGVAPIVPLHPAVLDACFQILGATFRGSGVEGGFLPLAIDRLVLHRAPQGPFWAHVRARPGARPDAGVATGDITLFDAAGQPIGAVEGLTIRRVGVAPAAPDPTDRWTYAVRWQPQDPPVRLPPPAVLAEAALAAAAAARPPEAPGLAEGLEALAAAYAARALAEVPAEAVAPGARRLHAHLPSLAADAPRDAAPEALAEALAARHGATLEVALARRSGAALPDVLRGEADPLAALFGGGDGAAVYADPPFARMLNAMVVAALRAAAAARPEGSRLRVLEIGAGTGAVFEALSRAELAEAIQFTFTDVSRAFVEAAAGRFGTALFRCAVLDIERAPAAQGFETDAFDVVLAANVLHATRDLDESLRHAAALLAPGGTLMVLEAATRSHWADLVFGSTPGWWRFADAALRPDHPLLSAAQWQELLATRFAEVALAPSPGGGAQVLAIARSPCTARPVLSWEAPEGMGARELAGAALDAAQAALAQPDRPALRIFTRGAWPVGDTPVAPAQAAAIGLGRVVAIEHPELDCRLLDLPPAMPGGTVPEPPPGASEAAWRDGRWHLPRLSRAALPAEAFETSGTHLVTGGLGGLGPLLADWLLARGAERVVLLGRRPADVALPAGAEAVIADVADRAALARIFAGIDAQGPPLRGVFHLAGALSDAAVLRLAPGDLDRVFTGKVDGAWNLDALVGDRALDAFVLFGSSAGLLGNAGQAAHAAANAALAALAEARQRRGLAALCVDWGAWGQAGAVVRPGVERRLLAAGAELMPPADALRALGRALASGLPRLLVAAIDWPRFLSGHGQAVPPFFAEVAPRRAAPIVATPSGATSGGDPRASLGALAALVAAEASSVLRTAPGELADDLPLSEAGLDSLLALELRKTLGERLGLTLPATLLFDHPTIARLTTHLAGEFGLNEGKVPPPAHRPAPAAAPVAAVASEAEVMGMSEDEVAALIAREFALAMKEGEGGG